MKRFAAKIKIVDLAGAKVNGKSGKGQIFIFFSFLFFRDFA